MVSCFDIIRNCWERTWDFDKNIVQVFRNEKDDWDYNIGIYFEDNRVKVIDTDDITVSTKWEIKNMS